MARLYEYTDVPPKCMNTLDNNNAHRNKARAIAFCSDLSDKRKSHLVIAILSYRSNRCKRKWCYRNHQLSNVSRFLSANRKRRMWLRCTDVRRTNKV